MRSRKAVIAGIAALSFLIGGHAQTPPQPLTETGLVLEVVFLQGRPPSYQQVISAKPKNLKEGGTWYGLFGRVAGWQPPSGALPVAAVRLVPYLTGETVNINVSVMRGSFLDTEDTIATYKTRENETATVSELEFFGVEPFVIKVVRTFSSAELPTTVNKTKSVAVVGLTPVGSTLPRYKITLHNLSDKSISALGINVVGQGRVRLTSLPQGDYGGPLIKAGESRTLDRTLALDAERSTGGYGLETAPNQQIVIESLIFADGSFEGELKPAARFLGFVVGNRIELRRILPLLDESLKASPDGAPIESLRSRIASLSYDLDDAELALLVAAFPTLDKHELRSSVEVAIHGVRRELLSALDRQQNSESTPRETGFWLARTHKLYSDWLTRLNAIDVVPR